MDRELRLIEERNNKKEVSFINKISNIVRCRTNKSQQELNFEKHAAKRKEILKRRDI